MTRIMWVMTHLSTNNNTVVFGLRITAEESARLKQLARHCGTTRPGFVRSAVALTDSMLTLNELQQMEKLGPLSADAREKQRCAHQRMEEIVGTLRPTPLALPSTT